jgi:hypothetical protein
LIGQGTNVSDTKIIQQLEKKLAMQKHEIAIMQKALHRKNIELDALHKVWCSGGCKTGTHRYSDVPITQEIVDAAVINTERLVLWWKHKQTRDGKRPPESCKPSVKKTIKAFVRQMLIRLAAKLI